jgi:hypothetical protein
LVRSLTGAKAPIGARPRSIKLRIQRLGAVHIVERLTLLARGVAQGRAENLTHRRAKRASCKSPRPTRRADTHEPIVRRLRLSLCDLEIFTADQDLTTAMRPAPSMIVNTAC